MNMYYQSTPSKITTESLAKAYDEHRLGKEQYESFLKQFEDQIKGDSKELLIQYHEFYLKTIGLVSHSGPEFMVDMFLNKNK